MWWLAWVPYKDRGSGLPGGSCCGLRFEVLSSLDLLKVGRLKPTVYEPGPPLHLGSNEKPVCSELGALEWPALQGALLDGVQGGWS